MKDGDISLQYRSESDSLGEVKVPLMSYWGAQTERSRKYFKIGAPASMPLPVIKAFAIVKKASAIANFELGVLSEEKMTLIADVCDEITAGYLDDQFPLVIWQTGSGTQTNMNLNEVISNRSHVREGGKLTDRSRRLHPNDDVNKSQSSNDTFPSAMYIASYSLIAGKTLPAAKKLRETLSEKVFQFNTVIKLGRTHFMDAVPLTLGQEFSGYVTQIDNGIRAIENAVVMLGELALGGSAVGTGLNTPEGFADRAAEKVAELTGFPFRSAPNKFEALAAHDAMVEASAALKRLAVSLYKIANDIRMLSSGPRSGIGEIFIPANEPGSSIMPGKVNPTQSEALTMVCLQVIANDTAVSMGGANGHFELNVFKPLIAANLLQSAELLADACYSFSEHCVKGIIPDLDTIGKHLSNSLMLATSLTPHIGYDQTARIAKKAYEEKITLRDAATKLGLITPEDFDKWVRPENMI